LNTANGAQPDAEEGRGGQRPPETEQQITRLRKMLDALERGVWRSGADSVGHRRMHGNEDHLGSGGSGGGALTVQKNDATVDGATNTLDFTDPDAATLLSSLPAGEVNVLMSLYALLAGRNPEQTLIGGALNGQNLHLRSNAVSAATGEVISDSTLEVAAGRELHADNIKSTTSGAGSGDQPTFPDGLNLEGTPRINSQAKAISAGVVTVLPTDPPWTVLSAESGVADDLDTLTQIASNVSVIFLSPAAGHTITLKHNTGNLKCMGEADVVLDQVYDFALLVRYTAGTWAVLPYGGGGGGGGTTPTLQDEGVALPQRTTYDFLGNYFQAQDDAAATVTRIRAGYSHYDAIVDSDEHVILVNETADVTTGTTVQVTTPGNPGWAVNQWARCRIIIYDAAGTTLRAVKVIDSNTSDTITWTGAVAGITNGDTFIVQPAPPNYRRLFEAIKGGHKSILYRKASGEISFAIAAGDAVNYILGDDGADAAISVSITCSRSGVIFDSLLINGVALNLQGTGDTAVGCRVNGAGATINLNAAGCTAINCSSSGGGSGATAPFEIRQASCRVIACIGTLLSCENMIKVATASAFRYSITGNVCLGNLETGYIISAGTGTDGVITSNVVTAPTTSLGGITSQNLGNIAGNYITLSNANQDGIQVTGRNAVSGNIIRPATLSGVRTQHAVRSTGTGDVISNNLFILGQVTGAATNVTLNVVRLEGGLATVSGNLGYMVVNFLGGATGTLTVLSLSAATIPYTAFGNTGIGPLGTDAPFPWRMVDTLNPQSEIFANTDLPRLTSLRYDEFEDFVGNANNTIPDAWEGFGTGGAVTYGTGGRGGVAVFNTGGVINQDVGIRLADNVVSGLSSRPGVEFIFELNSLADVRVRVGLGENGAWVTNMARPVDGLFFELDTAAGVSAILMKTGATIQQINVALAAGTRHSFALFLTRNDRLVAYFDRLLVGTYVNTGVWPLANLVCPGAFIRQLAAGAAKEMELDLIRWGCDRF
jgi:hypothetical protein